jgi:hypothetical protein
MNAYTDAGYQQNTMNVGEVPTDNGSLMRDIWASTIGKESGMTSPPQSRVYVNTNLRTRKPLTSEERELLIQLSRSNGIEIARDQVNMGTEIISPPIRLTNHFRIVVKFQKQATTITRNIQFGMIPNPMKPSNNIFTWNSNEAVRIHGSTSESNPDKIIFMDLNPGCANSPLHWTRERLLKCGIEKLEVDRVSGVKKAEAFYGWQDVAATNTERYLRDKKVEHMLLSSKLIGMPDQKSYPIVVKILGQAEADRIRTSAHPRNNLIYTLSKIAEERTVDVSRLLMGNYPDIMSAIDMASRLGVLEVKDGVWCRRLDDGTMEPYEGTYCDGLDRVKQETVLGDYFWGRGEDPVVNYEAHNELRALIDATRHAMKDARPEGLDHPVQAIPEEISDGLFYAALDQAFLEGKIMVDNAKKRLFFAGDVPESAPALGTFKAFKSEGLTRAEMFDRAKEEAFPKMLKNKEAILEYLKTVK